MKKCNACKCPIGYFGFSDSGDLIFFTLFSRNVVDCVEHFMKSEDKDFVSQLKDFEVEFNETALRYLRNNIRELALSLGFVDDEASFNSFMKEFSIELSKKSMHGSIKKDKLLIQAYNAHEDMSTMINTMNERLYEWFSLHYPEVQQSSVAKLVQKYGKRENFPGFSGSHGVDLSEEDERVFVSYASLITEMERERKILENYVQRSIGELMPNTASILEPLIAAKLLSITGSMEKLAKMPASSIQLLGAEKALFRHLKNRKERAPKYGILFNSRWLQSVSQEKRGRVARCLAAKIMIASRIDYYSGRFDETLRKDLENELKRC